MSEATREITRQTILDLEKRIAELKAALLAVILAYDDDNDAADPEKTLSDAIQAARAVWRGA